MAHEKRPEPVVAGGCLVTRGSGPDTEVLLIHRPKYDDWSVPKGKQDAGEHVLQTAIREVQEETGLTVWLRRPLPSREYLVEGVPKVVHYWRAEVAAQRPFEPSAEVDRVEWLPLCTAVDRATHPLDAQLIEHASAPAGTPFVVLRHAKARKRTGWDGPDPDRPLDRTGRRQAKALVPLLESYGVGAVHSSSAKRCMATVEPLAARLGVPLVREPSQTEEAFEQDPESSLARASGLMAEAGRAGVPTALCGHRPVMPALLTHLLAGTDLIGPTETIPTGSFVVLHLVDGTPVSLEHHLLD